MMGKRWENDGKMMGKRWENDGKTMGQKVAKLRMKPQAGKICKKAGKRRRIQQKSGKMQGTGRLNPPQIINRLVKHGG